ncbi:Chloroperoxidase [Xylogone sp. PMI_703]|nr:Chloroperoxidase [Xylogone sp. PMI_703]
MSSSASSLSSKPLARGEFSPAEPTDLRSPCPMVNCLANHGYIPRDGRSVHSGELMAAMNEIGLSSVLGALLSKPIFLEQTQQNRDADQQPRSFWSKTWNFIRNPWGAAFSSLGMRKPGQKDSMGIECLNLDQLALPGAIEHDISLTRRDHQQGDNISLQPDLVRDLLASSSDGGRTLTVEDLAAFRRRRIQTQKEVNPGMIYGPEQHELACAEIATVLKLFGDGKKVPYEYARSFFLEERLPIQEGWEKRRWWTLGILEIIWSTRTVKRLVGEDI